MTTNLSRPNMYDGEGDRLMQDRETDAIDHIVLVPDMMPSKTPDMNPKLRIMWGQHMLEDVLAGRYRSLVCAVNAENNSHGLVTQVASLLPSSQWTERSITHLARQFSQPGGVVRVLKYDMDAVEVLAVLKPPDHEHLTLDDLSLGFKIVTEMIHRRTQRQPSTSVSFLGAHSNLLLDDRGHEPSFEAVLRVMHDAGYVGDVYPSPGMWDMAPTGVYARYPFPPSIDMMREGGF